jgi:hypothetical protein
MQRTQPVSLPVPPAPSRIYGLYPNRHLWWPTTSQTSTAFGHARPQFLVPVGPDVPALAVSFAIEAVMPVLALRRLIDWGFNTVRRGIMKPARCVRSSRGASHALFWFGSDRSGPRFRGCRVAETHRRWSANRASRLFRTMFAPARSCIVRRTQSSPALDMGGFRRGSGRRVWPCFPDLGLRARSRDIIDQPLARAR